MPETIEIVFHGRNAASFSQDFQTLLDIDATVTLLPDTLEDAAQEDCFRRADVIVGNRFKNTLPAAERLKLYHVSAAGYDGIDMDALPATATVCNCFGHEQAIAEYVMAAILSQEVRLIDADRRLREGEWHYRASRAANAHGEIAGRTLGLLGFGHIGKAIAAKAKAFDMEIHVANRSPVSPGEQVDRFYGLDNLEAFYAAADFVVVSLPLTPHTRSLVAGEAFSQMRENAILVNVGRGPVVDERALYDALRNRRIAGAVIDTWYRYPSVDGEITMPSSLEFASLPNLVMTPHMSGWTDGTIRRRRATIAANINRYFSARPCENVVRQPLAQSR